jgi:hypothetical protein
MNWNEMITMRVEDVFIWCFMLFLIGTLCGYHFAKIVHRNGGEL